jgi:uncharacterized damage-inducible protein DinB|tara:strand:- start:182 stop:358 length:177 start_codon:yes stop_codon:yes gene_type:complete
MSEKKFSVLGYLKHMLNVDGDFLKEFKRLDTKERDELREAAIEEMEFKGIEIDNPGKL